MKYYQYITKGKAYPEEEFWVCESCRKQNCRFILEGKWRLIGKLANGDMACTECDKGAQDAAGLGTDDVPGTDLDTGGPDAPEIRA